MRIRTWLPFLFRKRRNAMHLLVTPSRYKQWAYGPEAHLRSLAPPALSQNEMLLAQYWGASQKEAWGWHLEIRRDPNGESCLLAFSGAEDAGIEWLIYRVEVGFQSDEWTGKSHWSPSLGHALSTIAPLPKVGSLVSA